MSVPSFYLYIEGELLAYEKECKGKLAEFYKGLEQRGIRPTVLSSPLGYKKIYVAGDVNKAIRFASEFDGFKTRKITTD